MSTIIDELKKNIIPDCIHNIVKHEGMSQEEIISGVLDGHIVIPRNNQHKGFDPIAIGKGTRIKVNANIGTSPNRCDFDDETDKVRAAVDSGADAVMDLSISGDISGFRKKNY